MLTVNSFIIQVLSVLSYVEFRYRVEHLHTELPLPQPEQRRPERGRPRERVSPPQALSGEIDQQCLERGNKERSLSCRNMHYRYKSIVSIKSSLGFW